MKTKRHYKKNKTLRKQRIFGHIIDNNQYGWKTIHVHGSAYQRGFAHGFLLHEELARTLRTYPFLVDHRLHTTPQQYIKASKKYIRPVLLKDYPEIYEEMEGIAAGASARGVAITVDFLIAWNSHSSITISHKGKCSAFIATGNATENGDIVMAHNTHTNFAEAQMFNIVMHVSPQRGHPFVMQTAAGLVASVTDWFICSTGIIGCETTISGINYKPKFGAPFFCRIRTAMQYAKTLDEYATIMQTNSAGDYACSWLFGDINTNEIMLCELGLKVVNIQKTANGAFYGMNSAIDTELRTKETTDNRWNDISKSTGARAKRFNQLLYDKYAGRISTDNAKLILSDHYDVFLHKSNPNIRTICKHTENDAESKTHPFYLHGCTDGKVTDSKMARELAFLARFGSACGRPFSIRDHIAKHPEYSVWEPYVEDFKPQPWTYIKLI
jgi:hypothetical protein